MLIAEVACQGNPALARGSWGANREGILEGF